MSGGATVRADPRTDRFPGQERLYGAIQSAWSAWARRRFREEFDRVRAFCLFVGYPRSGHSVVGAMLNAHRNGVVSHELDAPRLLLAGADRDELYARILSRAAWFNLRGNRSNYRYQIPNGWQGRFETLRVLGDKGGGWAAQWLARHPDLLQRIRSTTGVPLRLLHVVRNPWDNIAAISLWHRLPLDQSIDFYFSHCETTGSLGEREEMLTIRHEGFIDAPAARLADICSFLGLDADAHYLEACRSIVFDQATRSRSRVAWTSEQVAEVERRARRYPFLADYTFDPGDEAEPESTARGTPAAEARGAGRSVRWRAPSVVDRLAAWLNPQVARRGG